MRRKRLYTDQEVRIAFDPFRSKILDVFFIHKDTPMTAKQVADYMGEHPSKVNYHIQKLVSIEILKLDHTENINGIIAKFYVMPYDTVGLVRTDLSKQVTQNAMKNINESNFHIYSTWFEQDIETGRKLYEDSHDGQEFCLLSSHLTVHMTEEEFHDSIKKIGEILQSYYKENPDVNEYKVFMATVKTKQVPKK